MGLSALLLQMKKPPNTVRSLISLHSGFFQVRGPAPQVQALTDGARYTISLVLVCAIVVVVGLIAVLVHRFIKQNSSDKADDLSMTRPVLALLLVGSVVIFAAAVLGSSDTQTRNLLVGGVVSLASAAVAFYFASSGATEARRDLLKATSSSATVPDLTGQTVAQAQALVAATSLSLVNPASADADAKITKQLPPPGTLVPTGQPINVYVESDADPTTG